MNANKKASALFGMPVEEIKGMHQSKLHPESETERYINIFREYVNRGEVTATDLFVVNKSGALIPVDIIVKIIDVEGAKVIQGIFRCNMTL